MFGLEAEMYAFVAAALIAPARLAYEGKLWKTLGNSARLVVNPFLPRSKRREIAHSDMSWFRLGPAIFLDTVDAAIANFGAGVRASRGGATRGAVYVEFLIAFLPVLIFFMCLWQMSRLYTAGLAVQHAAVTAARSGAVILADDPARYGNGGRSSRTSRLCTALNLIRARALIHLSLRSSSTARCSAVKVAFPERARRDRPEAHAVRVERPVGLGTSDAAQGSTSCASTSR